MISIKPRPCPYCVVGAQTCWAAATDMTADQGGSIEAIAAVGTCDDNHTTVFTFPAGMIDIQVINRANTADTEDTSPTKAIITARGTRYRFYRLPGEAK